jgi:hypothetical protein
MKEMGYDNVKLPNVTNKAEEKWYSDVYIEFLKAIKGIDYTSQEDKEIEKIFY